jgi:hypothetical protein
MKKLNLIFLDIDGVMNNENYFHNGPEDLTWDTFDPKSVELLNRLTNKTKAKIIISSDWRKQHSLSELKRIFKKNKVTGEVIGTTPVLKFKPFKWADTNIIEDEINKRNNIPVRGLEINETLLSIKEAKSDYEIDYIILDDDISGALLLQNNHIVQTDPVYGFTESKLTMALYILED